MFVRLFLARSPCSTNFVMDRLAMAIKLAHPMVDTQISA
jgi:hypothetical protein